jgi:2-keto-4-pentenoate hydratase/2-oxohepta-3-ene-1,7-dioic acid hydratase in catechol pathway
MSAPRRFARYALAAGPRYAAIAGGEALVLDGAPWLGGRPTGERLRPVDDEGRGPSPRLAPVEPRKIVCVGRNYAAHAAELGNAPPPEPLLFFKPSSALLAPDGVLELPPPWLSERVEHEAELGIVVGARLRRASEREAAAAIFGYTVAGDVTARDLQKKDGQWARAKGMDGFCPVGPVVVGGLDAGALEIRASVSGVVRQRGTTADMIWSPPALLTFISQAMTLEPGDLVLTGTPAGVGPLAPGDELRMAIGGIGELVVHVRAAPES